MSDSYGPSEDYTDYVFKCCYCGYQTDGDIYHNPPDVCKVCGCVDFERAQPQPEPIDDRKLNEHDFDYLAGKGN